MSTFFKDLYEKAETGVASSVVAPGTYNVVVAGARANPKGSQIWLTLTVQDGVDAGKSSDVSLYIPKEGDSSGAVTFFIRKVNGLIAYPDVKAAFQSADNAPDRDSGLAHIADALVGKAVVAEITLRKDGDYAGTNELKSTKPLGGQQAPSDNGFVGQVVATEPAPVQAPAPAQGGAATPF